MNVARVIATPFRRYVVADDGVNLGSGLILLYMVCSLSNCLFPPGKIGCLALARGEYSGRSARRLLAANSPGERPQPGSGGSGLPALAGEGAGWSPGWVSPGCNCRALVESRSALPHPAGDRRAPQC